jgi:hypothetical protein
VRAGLVASLARPGGNITGNTILSPDLGGKRLQILREAIASVSRVAYLANPDNASTMATLAEMKHAAASAGMTLIGIEVGSGTDFNGVFTAMLREALATTDSWLPALPDGTSVGQLPPTLHQRYIDLYKTFAERWRVTAATSLFDYAPGTSTATFTLDDWPPENPPCVAPGSPPGDIPQ